MLDAKTLDIIAVSSDLGGNLRGSALAPLALLALGLKRKLEELGHSIDDIISLNIPIIDTLHPLFKEHKYIVPIAEICQDVMKKTIASLEKSKLPLILGGDHSIAIGSISGVASHCKKQGKELGVVWIDAHADFNTESSSPTGNIHGMPLAHVVGRGYEILRAKGSAQVKPENIVLLGIRDIDTEEKKQLCSSGITYFTMRDLDEHGINTITKKTLQALSGVDSIHLSFDIDSMDPLYAPGVSLPVLGGLVYREARFLLEKLYATKKLVSLEFVELNPIYDIRSQTAQMTIDLIMTALGKVII